MDRQEMRDYLQDVFTYNVLSHYGDKILSHEDSLLDRMVITISDNMKGSKKGRKCKTYIVRSKIRSVTDEVKIDYTFLVNDEMLDVFLNDVLDLDVDSTEYFDCKSVIIEEYFSSDRHRLDMYSSLEESSSQVRVFVIDNR